LNWGKEFKSMMEIKNLLKYYALICVKIHSMKKISFLLTLFIPFLTFSQIGGNTTFALLDLTYSARSAGLGGDFITAKDEDLNLTVANPSLYNSKMHNHVGFNQALLAGGVNYGMINYARAFKNAITGGASLRYVNYGKQEMRNEAGTSIGTFTPGEFILGAGAAKQLNPQITIGANVNLIYSQLAGYNSFGGSLDLAGTYELEKANLLVTALVKNAGYQFKSYTKDNRSNLPTEFQLGVSHKLKHAPFRFSILAHHLNTWDLTYNDPTLKPTIDPLTGDTIPVKVAGFGKKLAHHFTYQIEILISKNIHFRTAFDYHRRQEMGVAAKQGLAGFSTGIGLYFKRFSLDYGFVVYSSAGYNNMLTLTTNLDKWRK
jgi:hypothetical protein